MGSYYESIEGYEFYEAELNGGKCKTYNGFMQELISAFVLPSSILLNINVITGYIFSSWLNEKKIKLILKNTGALKKNIDQYNLILETFESWKFFWENTDEENKVLIVIE